MAERALATAFVNIVPGTKDLESYLKKDLGDQAEKAGDDSGKRMGSGFASAAKSFIGPLVASFSAFAAIDFFKGAIESASTLSESQNAIKVTFGEASGAIAKLGEDSATRLGLSTSAFNGIATQFSAFATTIAGSGGDVAKVVDDLSTRGADFASVMNLDVNEALGLFQSGLAGETEPLRKYGIDMSAAATEAYALANGIWDGTGQMTEAQKVQARYGALMAQTSKTQGDFANTATGLANSQRIANAEIENGKARLGSALLPIMAAVTTFLATNFIPILDAVAGAFKWMVDNANISIPVLAALGAIILGALAPSIWAAVTATWAFTVALLANPITWIVLGIGLLVAAIVALVMNWDTVVKFITDIWGKFTKWIGETLNNIGKWFSDVFKGIQNVIGSVITWVTQNWPLLLAIITGPIGLAVLFITQNWDKIKNATTTVFGAIGNFIRDTFENVVAFVKAPINAIIGLINGMIRSINSISVSIPDWVPGVGGKKLGFSLGQIPYLANGGFVTQPTTAVIGEAGPEVVTPLKDFERMMGIGNGKGQTVNYYAAPNQSLDSEQALFTAIQRAKVLAAW